MLTFLAGFIVGTWAVFGASALGHYLHDRDLAQQRAARQRAVWAELDKLAAEIAAARRRPAELDDADRHA